MSGTAAAIIGIVSLVATIAAKSAEAGMAAKAADEASLSEEERRKLEKKRREEVRTQQKRATDIRGLERQMTRRRGAEQVARQVPGARPIQRGKLEAPPAPAPSAPMPKPKLVPEALRAPVAAPKADTGISPGGLDAISGGVQLAGQVAGGITGAAGAANEAKAREEEAAQLARLQEEEFQKTLAAKKRDVNFAGLALQDKSAAGPGATARQNTFASDFMTALRNNRNPRKTA